MVRSSQSCCVLGLSSSVQAAGFGLGCALLGAIVASFCWASLETEDPVSPRLITRDTPSRQQPLAAGANGAAGSRVEVRAISDRVPNVKTSAVHCSHCVDGTCCHCQTGAAAANHVCQLKDCQQCAQQNVVHGLGTCGHEDCAFCKARAAKLNEQVVEQPSVDSSPIHMLSGYRVASPDILWVEVSPPEGQQQDPTEQPIHGEHLIDPDGMLNLGSWGMVPVEGMTVAEIRRAIQAVVSAEDEASNLELDEPAKREVFVSVHSQNSKVYFVMEQSGFSSGDMAHRYPFVGNETALDAVCRNTPLTQLKNKKIWIARPTAGTGGIDTILPVTVNWTSQGTLVCTNPKLLPGDRVFVQSSPTWVAFLNSVRQSGNTRQAKKPGATGFAQ